MNKTLVILATALLCTVNIFSQDLGKMIIRNASANYPKFIASLNGIRQSNDYAGSVQFNNLEENSYRLKLLLAGSTSIITYTVSSEPRYLSKYVLMKDNFGNFNLMLESKSLIMDGDEPVHTPTLVPSSTTVIVTQTVAVNTNTVGNTPTSAATSTVVEIKAITKPEFDERLTAIKNTSFDNDRLSKAQQVFDDEYLTTNQVIEVVKVFSFDDSKLGFAKWVYKRTIDKKNFYKVEDHLSFGNSKNELREFVKKQPK